MTALDERAKKVRAAAGKAAKAALAKRRAADKKRAADKREADKAALKAKRLNDVKAADVFRKKVAEDFAKQEEAMRLSRAPREVQTPKEIEGVPGSVVGRISAGKLAEFVASLNDMTVAFNEAAPYFYPLKDALDGMGDVSRFDGSPYTDMPGWIETARARWDSMQPSMDALSELIAAIDTSGIFSVFDEGKRRRRK